MGGNIRENVLSPCTFVRLTKTPDIRARIVQAHPSHRRVERREEGWI